MKDEILQYLSPITPEEREILNGKDSVDWNVYVDRCGHVVNAKKLLQEGKSIAIRPHTRFVHFPKHTHDYTEMIYMCKGKTTHLINGNRVVVSEGEILILNPHAYQEILPADQGDIAVNFIILPRFFDRTLEMMGNEDSLLRHFIVDCIAGRENSQGYLHFQTKGILPIENLVENLIYYLCADPSDQREAAEFTMGLLLLQLIGRSDKLIYETHEKSAVVKVLSYIEENYQSGSLTQVARQMHYDLFWLSREIKMKTGKTYTELLQEKRLSRAADLLSHTNLRVSDVAAAVGYSNMSYFHKIFEEKYQQTPNGFRKTHRV